MPTEEEVEELVDKAIDEALIKAGLQDEEIKKRKPKPFRYLKNDEEIKAELKSEQTPPSIMTPPESPKIVDDFLKQVSMGDIETIENVIRKHQISRQFKK